MGMTLSQAFNLMLFQIRNKRKIPFKLSDTREILISDAADKIIAENLDAFKELAK
jgi:antitoxin component of RelBE/YafQ-DinJ toxin-antitoxin module